MLSFYHKQCGQNDMTLQTIETHVFLYQSYNLLLQLLSNAPNQRRFSFQNCEFTENSLKMMFLFGFGNLPFSRIITMYVFYLFFSLLFLMLIVVIMLWAKNTNEPCARDFDEKIMHLYHLFKTSKTNTAECGSLLLRYFCQIVN